MRHTMETVAPSQSDSALHQQTQVHFIETCGENASKPIKQSPKHHGQNSANDPSQELIYYNPSPLSSAILNLVDSSASKRTMACGHQFKMSTEHVVQIDHPHKATYQTDLSPSHMNTSGPLSHVTSIEVPHQKDASHLHHSQQQSNDSNTNMVNVSCVSSSRWTGADTLQMYSHHRSNDSITLAKNRKKKPRWPALNSPVSFHCPLSNRSCLVTVLVCLFCACTVSESLSLSRPSTSVNDENPDLSGYSNIDIYMSETNKTDHKSGNDTRICYTDQCISASGYLSASIDFEAKPCDNFYQFACGKWINDHPIPQYLHSWSQFQRLSFGIRNDLNKHLEDRSLFDANFTAFRKLHDFYHGCINTTLRNSAGYSLLYKVIDELGGWPMLDGDQWDTNSSPTFRWENAYIRLTELNLYFFIGIEPIVDFRNTSRTIIKLGPPYKSKENIINLGPIEMFYKEPDSAYSFIGRKRDLVKENPAQDSENIAENSQNDKFRKLYMKVATELKKFQPGNGSSVPFNNTLLNSDIDAIFKMQSELETRAAPIRSMSYYQSHYEEHLMNTTQIRNLVDFDIIFIVEKMFNKTVNENDIFFVPDIDYLKELGPLIKTTPKRTLANYFTANMVFSIGRHTTTQMLELLVTELDSPEVLPNVCYEETALYLPELLGRLYVDIYFNQNSREDVQSVAKLLHESFHQLLTESQWMDANTSKEAIDKLDAMSMNVAYPDWYTNHSKFEQYCSMYNRIEVDNYFSSVVNVNQARQLISIHELNEQSDSSLSLSLSLGWPRRQIIDVNAFYYFTTNGVYIPAGILQSPIYMKDLPSAITFGSIGMIIGHEMTHAFDNSGRVYDMHGALRNWWTNKTRDLFSEKADCFVKQYSSFQIGSIKMNGNQTLAENIADNGGLREAYRAFKIHQKRIGLEKDLRLPGTMSKFDTDQLFFISFANMWCANMDQDAIQNDVANNAHSPPSIRVIGSLANFDSFSEAFHCPVGSKMNPKDKCILW